MTRSNVHHMVALIRESNLSPGDMAHELMVTYGGQTWPSPIPQRAIDRMRRDAEIQELWASSCGIATIRERFSLSDSQIYTILARVINS